MALLKNKTVVVTGASSGVGLATVARCLAEEASVHALDLSASPLAGKDNLHSEIVDVSDHEHWQRFSQAFEAGSIDHLHLNAGIQSAPPSAPLADYQFSSLDLNRYRQMMSVNVDGVVLGLHHLLPKMRPGGSIVITGSLAGITPYHVDPLYSMSKHAVTGLVRSLVQELSTMDLRINALCPGGIDTALIPHDQRTDLSQFMAPDDIAAEVIRLFDTTESGETWAKVSAAKPAWIIYPPGKRKEN